MDKKLILKYKHMHSYDCLYYVDGMYVCMSIIKTMDICIQL
jgi:hypothetical protein